MDWKDGLTAAVVVGLGYWGIKSITKDDEDLPDAVCIHCGSIEIAMGGGLCIDCGRHPFNYGRAITAKEDDGYSDNSNTVFDAESFNAIVGTLNNCPECNEPLGGVYLLDNAYGRQDRVQSCKCGWYEVEPSYGAESFSAEYIMVKCDSCGKEKEKNWDEGGHQLSRVSAFPSKRPAKGFRYCSPCDEHICDSCRTDGHKHFDRTGCESHDMISGRLARKWKKEIAERKAKKKAESFGAEDKMGGIVWGFLDEELVRKNEYGQKEIYNRKAKLHIVRYPDQDGRNGVIYKWRVDGYYDIGWADNDTLIADYKTEISQWNEYREYLEQKEHDTDLAKQEEPLKYIDTWPYEAESFNAEGLSEGENLKKIRKDFEGHGKWLIKKSKETVEDLDARGGRWGPLDGYDPNDPKNADKVMLRELQSDARFVSKRLEKLGKGDFEAESFSADKFGIKWGPEDMPCPKCGETTLELTEDLGRSGYRGFKGRYFYTCTEQMQYGKIGCDSGSWEGSEVLEHALENLDTSQLIAIIMGLEDREEYVMDSVLNAAESFSAEKEDMYFVFADGTTMIEAYDDYNHTYLHWKIPYSEIRDYVNEWTDNLKSDQEWRLDPHDIAYAFASGKWKDDSQYEPHGFEWKTAIFEAVKSRIPDDGTWNRDLEEPMTKAEIRSFLTGIDEGYLSKRAESFNAEYPESVSCAWCNREFNPNRDKHFEYNGEFMHNECGFRCIYDYMCWGNYEGKIKRYDAETWTEDMVCLKCNNPFDGCSCERCPQCDEFWNDAWANCDDCHSCDDCCQESCPHLWDAESHAYSYAYNEGHSDSRKTGEYRPSLSTGSQEASFKRVLKQKGD